jgi:3',5'-nucleoside bisphosphate phosphatase
VPGSSPARVPSSPPAATDSLVIEGRSGLFDLHVHTARSDGLDALPTVAELAQRSGLTGFAVTDHDILPEAAELEATAARFGQLILPGVELSTQLGGRSLHLLGYGVTPTPALVAACDQLQTQRRERFAALVALLRQRQVPIGQPTPPLVPGRLHLARLLVTLRKARTILEAFRRYLQPLANQVPPLGLPFAEAVALLRQAGAVPVLAHPPADLTVAEWRTVVAAGLGGIETHFPAASRPHQRFLLARCQEYHLPATSGSDYHGDEGRRQLGVPATPASGLATLFPGRFGESA